MLFLRLSMRFVVSDYLHLARGTTEARRRLLIYGAGRGGQQLANSLRTEPHPLLDGYIAVDERLSNQHLAGITAWQYSILTRYTAETRVDGALMALHTEPTPSHR